MDRAWTLGSEGTSGAKDECVPPGAARLLRPERWQHVFEDSCLDLQLPPEHRARLVWAFVDVEARTGVTVREHITDGGYILKEQIEEEEHAGVAVIQPLPKARDGSPCLAHPDDGPGVEAWRARMQTPEAQEKLKQRAGIAETPHAELKTYRALDRLLVRGVEKATAVALLGAVSYNLLHFAAHLLAAPTG